MASSIQSFVAASTAMVASSSHRILEYIPDIADGDIDNPGALRRLRQYITGLWYYATIISRRAASLRRLFYGGRLHSGRRPAVGAGRSLVLHATEAFILSKANEGRIQVDGLTAAFSPFLRVAC